MVFDEKLIINEDDVPVRECVTFLERVKWINKLTNSKIYVKIRNWEGYFTITKNCSHEFIIGEVHHANGENSGKKSLHIGVDWFVRTKSISLSDIEEIWVDDIPLFYHGKAYVYIVRDNTIEKDIHIPFNKYIDFCESNIRATNFRTTPHQQYSIRFEQREWDNIVKEKVCR